MIRSLAILVVAFLLPEVSKAQPQKSTRSEFTIRTVDVGGEIAAVIAVESGPDRFSVRVSDGKLQGIRVSPGFPYEVSWEASGQDTDSSIIRLRRAGGRGAGLLVEVILISREQAITFADEATFRRIFESDSLRGGLDAITEQFIRDVTEEEPEGEQGARPNAAEPPRHAETSP